MKACWGWILAIGMLAVWQHPLCAQQPGVPVSPPSPEAAVVESAEQVLKEVMAIPASSIPKSLLAEAEGIAIIPGMIKGGFVIGVRRGKGVVVIKEPTGGWQLPQFVTLTGGSFGWQAGIQATDLVLVFKTRKSVDGLLSGKFTIGGDASAAAGPVGRDAAVATDVGLKAEIYSYSRSRGLFAGVALDGTVLQIDSQAAAAFYPRTPATSAGQPETIAVPPSAARLMEVVVKYTSPATAAGTPTPAIQEPLGTELPVVPVTDPVAVTLRRKLTDASRRLNSLLDPSWQRYLAIPPEALRDEGQQSAEAIGQVLNRFHTIAGNPRYRALTERSEFTETQQLLEQLLALQTKPALDLPPPPR